jgi:hypothetical protein
VISTTHARASGTEWAMDLEGRPGIPLEVTVQGDSLVMETEEYESILRPGVMTRVRTASVLREGGLEGNVMVPYRAVGGEEQVRGTMESRRLPQVSTPASHRGVNHLPAAPIRSAHP